MRAVAAARIKDDRTAQDAELGMNWPTTPHPVENVLAFPRMGPLVGITHRRCRKFTAGGKTRTFYVVLHAAYDARGLVGTECNGVAVLDGDAKDVLIDQHCASASGYYGPTQTQIDEWARVCAMTYAQLRAFVYGHPRCRPVGPDRM